MPESEADVSNELQTEEIASNIDQYKHFAVGDEAHQVFILDEPIEKGGEKIYLIISKQLGFRTIHFNNGRTLSTGQLEPLFRWYLKKEQEKEQADKHQNPIVIRQGGGLYPEGKNLKVNIGEFSTSDLDITPIELKLLIDKNKNKKQIS